MGTPTTSAAAFLTPFARFIPSCRQGRFNYKLISRYRVSHLVHLPLPASPPIPNHHHSALRRVAVVLAFESFLVMEILMRMTSCDTICSTVTSLRWKTATIRPSKRKGDGQRECGEAAVSGQGQASAAFENICGEGFRLMPQTLTKKA